LGRKKGAWHFNAGQATTFVSGKFAPFGNVPKEVKLQRSPRAISTPTDKTRKEDTNKMK
jgi:hypothetical protein